MEIFGSETETSRLKLLSLLLTEVHICRQITNQ